MNTITIGLFGFGTVGSEVVNILTKHSDTITQKTGKKVCIKYIAARNSLDKKEKSEQFPQYKNLFTENHENIWNDGEVNCIIELIGGTEIAKDIIEKAIATKRHVITANKAVLAEYGNEMFANAKTQNIHLGYEASIGGGIPIIETLKRHMAVGEITKIEGILNGTCNYMLSNMEEKKCSYAEILRDAQEKGFAEANPSADVDGWDTAAKIALLSSLCFNTKIFKMTDFPVIGISEITAEKIQHANANNKKIRLVASAEKLINTTNKKSEIKISVSPQEVDSNNMFYSVNGPDNMVIIHHEYLGEIVLKGAGAGGEATAMSVISDIINI